MSDIINDAAHPEWRQLCQAALFETDPVNCSNASPMLAMPFLIASKMAIRNRRLASKLPCETHWRLWIRCAELRSDKMAISQRLVDPSRMIRVPTRYSWQDSYRAALLETDWTRMVSWFRQQSPKYTKGGWSFLKTTTEHKKNVRLSSMR